MSTASSSTQQACPVVAYIVSNDLVKVCRTHTPLPCILYVCSILSQISSLLPSNKSRSILVHSLVKSYGLLASPDDAPCRVRVIPPVLASMDALAMYHSREYLEFILDPRNCSADAMAADLERFGIEEVSMSLIYAREGKR